jgi:hypothetical protein
MMAEEEDWLAMTPDLKQIGARRQLRLARERLRACEEAFHQHLADDPLPWIDEIAKAEQFVAQARARVGAAMAEACLDQVAKATVTISTDFEKVIHPAGDVDERILLRV